MIGTLALVGFATVLIDIQGATDCPTVAEVMAEKGRLAAPGPAPASAGALPHATALLTRSEGRLRLELRSDRNVVVKERQLLLRSPSGTEPSCQDLAAAAAVVITSWETDLDSGLELVLTSRPPPSAARLLPVATVTGGVSFVTLVNEHGAAFGGSLEGLLWRGQGRLAARLAFVGTTSYSEKLGEGHGLWNRYWFVVGPRYRLGRNGWYVDLDAGFIAALLWVEGSGFKPSKRELDVDPGLMVGVRVVRQLGAIAPFVGAALAGWLRREELDVASSTETFGLPRLEGLFSAGILVGKHSP